MKEFIVETSNFLKNRICFAAFWGYKIQKNKIVITNYFGKGFGDSAKYVVKELLRKNENLNIVWLVNDVNRDNEIPEGVREVKFNTINAIYELATARIWIDNSRKMNGELKRESNAIYKFGMDLDLKSVKRMWKPSFLRVMYIC